eukprot:CAMPEP_0169124926 /NCGR_PEP_ID=MMETSP1015-20121227/34595_1 /TAXON_ID=342587 /ORGANISM="Karlodinium micrum, Strain CCMP2283" /LENGTH=129 /DNA_ID=CAMNT_0009188395 /DNA_START=101 /DNA_END=490 /DNA_ORIENTATION=-
MLSERLYNKRHKEFAPQKYGKRYRSSILGQKQLATITAKQKFVVARYNDEESLVGKPYEDWKDVDSLSADSADSVGTSGIIDKKGLRLSLEFRELDRHSAQLISSASASVTSWYSKMAMSKSLSTSSKL